MRDDKRCRRSCSDGRARWRPAAGACACLLSVLASGCPTPNCVIPVGGGTAEVRCGSLVYDVTVPDTCPDGGCALLVDVHGLTMSARIQERSTRLAERGPPRGYVVVQPSAPAFAPTSSWSPRHDEEVRAFLEEVIDQLAIDPDRVHMTGFSQGGFMSWRFACHSSDLVASIAPAAAGAGCPALASWGCLFEAGAPADQVDVLFMHGVTDALVDFETCAVPQRDSVIARFDLEEVEREEHLDYLRARFLGPEKDGERPAEMLYLEHSYSNGHPILEGHCFPGSPDLQAALPGQLFAFGCDQQAGFEWGAEVLDFFDAHRRR